MGMLELLGGWGKLTGLKQKMRGGYPLALPDCLPTMGWWHMIVAPNLTAPQAIF
jgi:hypothetical protein